MSRDPRRAYRVVDDFEDELCAFTGAPYAVAVDSCTNALFLSLTWQRINFGVRKVGIPRRTYVGVLQAVRNAELEPVWMGPRWDYWLRDRPWYPMPPEYPEPWGAPGDPIVIDSARHLKRNMYPLRTVEGGFHASILEWHGSLVCLSFHAAKQLPLGRGGAILTDNPEAAEWLRAARMDGRPPGAPIEATLPRGWHCPMPPPIAAQGLWTLSRWVDSGYEPAPLVDEEYPDLSVL